VETRFEVSGRWDTHRGSPSMEVQLNGGGPASAGCMIGVGHRWLGQQVPWHTGSAGGGDGGPRGWLELAIVGEKPTIEEDACRWVASMAHRSGEAKLSDGARSGRRWRLLER
jgi:hypothetical protein